MPKAVRISETRCKVRLVVPIDLWQEVVKLSERLKLDDHELAVAALATGVAGLRGGLQLQELGYTDEDVDTMSARVLEAIKGSQEPPQAEVA